MYVLFSSEVLWLLKGRGGVSLSQLLEYTGALPHIPFCYTTNENDGCYISWWEGCHSLHCGLTSHPRKWCIVLDMNCMIDAQPIDLWHSLYLFSCWLWYNPISNDEESQILLLITIFLDSLLLRSYQWKSISHIRWCCVRWDIGRTFLFVHVKNIWLFVFSFQLYILGI